MQPFRNFQVFGWAALPNIPCHDPAHFVTMINHFVLMLCRYLTTFKSTAGRAPPITVQLISRCWKHFLVWMVWSFQNHSNLWLGRAPPFAAQFLSRCWRTFSSGCYAAIQNHSSLWLGRAPQHPLSQPSSLCGVEESFRRDVMQIVNNVQINGSSCFLKHDPAHFTVSNNFLVWMVSNFSKTIDFMAGPCSPKHGPVPFTVLKNLFVWMLCSHLKTFKFMIWLRSSTFFATAQLVSQRWTTFS